MSKKMGILLLASNFIAPFGHSASRNICDDLIDSGMSKESIGKCITDHGKSDFRVKVEEEAEEQKKEDAIKSEILASKKDNIEFKKFNEEELKLKGYGLPFFAMRVDYNKNNYKVKRITEGNSLCHYLGFEKVIESKVSNDIRPKEADKGGLIIDTDWLNNPKDQPEMYKDEDHEYYVRKYLEISCAKRKDKTVDPSNEILESLNENLIEVEDTLDAPGGTSDKRVDSQSRRKKEVKGSEHGYKSPFPDEALGK